MTRRTAILGIVTGALAALVALVTFAPDYLASQGFPLDDAWIHAVYGRALSRSGSLAYNPGIPATGSTSPLWSVLFAIPHLLGSKVGGVVVLIKLLGFGLHVLMAVVLYLMLEDDSAFSPAAAFGALLVVFHPDLVSASVSGMEVPLASLLAVGIVYAATRGRVGLYAILSGLGVLARPELALLNVVAVANPARRWRLLAAGLLGGLVTFGLLALRNLAVSGLPLPGPFYAKVGGGIVSIPQALELGFGRLLAQLPIVDSSILLVTGAVTSVLLLSMRTGVGDSLATAAASLLCGLFYCAASFLLVAPVDPESFYHQRYVLPVLPLIVGPLPLLADGLIRWYVPRSRAVFPQVFLLALLAGSLLVDVPARYRRLSSDARNVDDVQVRLGRALAQASPSEIVWAIDAGAIRYFGGAYVVDLMGLNTPPLLDGDAQEFLDRHPPSYVEIVPTWSRLDGESLHALRGALFEPSTEYTVTSFPAMQKHWLVRCNHGWDQGRLAVRSRSFRFSCARSDTAVRTRARAAEPSGVTAQVSPLDGAHSM